MRAHRLAWLASLALMAAGGVTAHAAAYRLVAPPHPGHHHAAEGGLAHLHLCLALCGTVVLVAFGASLLARARAWHALRPPLWLFAVLPPAGFAVQEHLERLLQTGALPWGTALEAVFAVGVLLQIPFALAAYLAARVLFTLAAVVVAELRRAYRPARVSLSLLFPVSYVLRVPRELVPAGGLGGRAPPAAAAV